MQTLITLAVFIILGAIWFIYLSVSFKSDFERAKDLDVTVTFNEEEFNEAIEADGTIYALGKIYGGIDFDNINFDDLEFKGKDKEGKTGLFKSEMTGGDQGQLYLEVFSVEVSKQVEREDNKEDYVTYTFIPYSNSLVYVADNFEFYGKNFPFNESLAKSLGGFEQSYVENKDREHFTRGKYLPSGVSVWVEFEILNGELLEESLKLHSDFGYFDDLARAISGEDTYSAGLNLISVIFFTLIIFAITTYIQRKFF